MKQPPPFCRILETATKKVKEEAFYMKRAIDANDLKAALEHATNLLREVNLLIIYICNFHVLSHLLLIYICKLHWIIRCSYVRYITSDLHV